MRTVHTGCGRSQLFTAYNFIGTMLLLDQSFFSNPNKDINKPSINITKLINSFLKLKPVNS